MKNNLFAFTFMALLFFAQSSHAQIQGDGKAGLVITPTRVELEGKQRSASITIANNGTTKGAYKIELVNKIMTEDGRLLDVIDKSQNDNYADKMIRISPRRVNLEAGANQSIRILVRKPQNLADGEYRTHLSVMIMPDDSSTPKEEEQKTDKLTIEVKANYGVTIPIIVRNGNLSVSAKMEDLNYTPATPDGKQPAKVGFTVIRDGNKSLYGDIQVIYTNNKGAESFVKFLGGMAIYTTNKKRDFEIPLDIADSTKVVGGTIKVIYREKEKSGGKIIAQQDLKMQ